MALRNGEGKCEFVFLVDHVYICVGWNPGLGLALVPLEFETYFLAYSFAVVRFEIVIAQQIPSTTVSWGLSFIDLGNNPRSLASNILGFVRLARNIPVERVTLWGKGSDCSCTSAFHRPTFFLVIRPSTSCPLFHCSPPDHSFRFITDVLRLFSYNWVGPRSGLSPPPTAVHLLVCRPAWTNVYSSALPLCISFSIRNQHGPGYTVKPHQLGITDYSNTMARLIHTNVIKECPYIYTPRIDDAD